MGRWARVLAAAMVLSTVVSAAHADARLDQPRERRRVVLTWSGAMVGSTAAMGAGMLTGALRSRGCDDSTSSFDAYFASLGCTHRAIVTGTALSAALLPVATTLGAYLPHRLNGGRAPVWVAVTASLAGAATTAAGAIAVAASEPSDRLLIPALLMAGMIGAVVPALALQWSHARRPPPPTDRSASEHVANRVRAQAVAVQGGLWLGVRGQL